MFCSLFRAVEKELGNARVAFHKRYQELEATQSQLDRQDPDLQRMRRQVQALDQRVNDLTDGLEAAEDENERLQEAVDRASEAQRDTLHLRGASLLGMEKNLPTVTIPPKKGKR